VRRLGEHLVQAGLIKREQLAEALRAQVVWGARIGTNLVELGHLEIDDLSRTLGRQLKMPSALASHFERADPALQKKLPKDVAKHLHCIPLVLANQYAVIAIGKPLSTVEMDVIATHLGVEMDKLFTRAKVRREDRARAGTRLRPDDRSLPFRVREVLALGDPAVIDADA
jgi:hypothetical protein